MHACWVASVMPDSLRPHGLSPPGSSVHGILQARILEWVAFPFSRGSSRSKDRIRFSCVSCIGRWVLYPQCHLGSPRNPQQWFSVPVVPSLSCQRHQSYGQISPCWERELIPLQFCSVAQSCPTLQPHGLQHTRLPCPSPTPRVYSNSRPSSW